MRSQTATRSLDADRFGDVRRHAAAFTREARSTWLSWDRRPTRSSVAHRAPCSRGGLRDRASCDRGGGHQHAHHDPRMITSFTSRIRSWTGNPHTNGRRRRAHTRSLDRGDRSWSNGFCRNFGTVGGREHFLQPTATITLRRITSLHEGLGEGNGGRDVASFRAPAPTGAAVSDGPCPQGASACPEICRC